MPKSHETELVRYHERERPDITSEQHNDPSITSHGRLRLWYVLITEAKPGHWYQCTLQDESGKHIQICCAFSALAMNPFFDGEMSTI